MMHIELTVAVRNPEWYWPPIQINQDKAYYEEWKALNEDKVQKYTDAIKFRIDATEIREDRNAIYPLRFKDPATSALHMVPVSDVTVITYLSEKGTSDFVISNSILHQYIGAQRRGKKYYTYFYIKEETAYEQIHELIWLSKPAYAEIASKLG